MFLAKLKEECQQNFDGELPKREYQNGLSICLEILYRVSRDTAVQQNICAFGNY